jgi:hypothetical protein
VKNLTYTLLKGIVIMLVALYAQTPARAQETVVAVPDTLESVPVDTVMIPIPVHEGDSVRKSEIVVNDTTITEGKLTMLPNDTVTITQTVKQWKKPSPKRAMWLALVLPGAGQIYNNKLWKLPIFYGGFLGCIYALRWNNQQYKDYSQAYLDIMDDDPNTQSYNQYMHLGRRIDSTNEKYFKNVFKKRKDFYRRYRDMSFFVLIGVYALSVIDAYVDASLAQFDISDDLSLHVTPSVINSRTSNNPFKSSALGLQCSLSF